jgi:hypothetical protein
MRTIKMKKLIQHRNGLVDRLNSVHDADYDPNIKAVYQSDLQYELMKVENEIDFEMSMRPFRWMLATFVVVVILLFICLLLA